MTAAPVERRLCAGTDCKTVLSRYNTDSIYCAACEPRAEAAGVPLPSPNTRSSVQPQADKPKRVRAPRPSRAKAQLDAAIHPVSATVKCRICGAPALERTANSTSPRWANLCLEHWQHERQRNPGRPPGPRPGEHPGPPPDRPMPKRHTNGASTVTSVPAPPETRLGLLAKLTELGTELDRLEAERNALNTAVAAKLDEWASVLYALGNLDDARPPAST